MIFGIQYEALLEFVVVSALMEYEYPMCSCLINDKIYWTWFLRTCSTLYFLGSASGITKICASKERCLIMARRGERESEREGKYCRKNHIYDAHSMRLVQSRCWFFVHFIVRRTTWANRDPSAHMLMLIDFMA